MAHSDPPQPGPGPGPDPDNAGNDPGGDDDAQSTLRRLEERIDRASAAAERLIADAGAHAAERVSRLRPPPSGWQMPEDPDLDADGDAALRPREMELLSQVLRSLRDLIPPELERRLAEALRELLLAIRALIDWYVERLDRGGSESVEVEDIPIR